MNNPYATPQADMGSQISAYQYAGFWIRFVASFIDSILSMLILGPIFYALYGVEYFTGQASMGAVSTLINYVGPAIVVILFWVYKSATPGKMICGIKIVDEATGSNPKVGQSILRYVGYYVSAIVLLLGFFWVIWDSKKQGWHDKIAGTVVIKSN